MNILFKKDKYDPTKVMKNYTKLLEEVYSVKLDSRFKNLKIFYYTKIKYPMFRRYIINLIKQNMKMVYKDPKNFIPVIMGFVIFIIGYCKFYKLNINDLMKKMYPNSNNEITFYYDNMNPNLLNKVIIINRHSSLTKHKFVQTKCRLIMDEFSYELEQTIYDCDTYEQTKTANIEYYKLLKIDRLGELINPNYILDNNLKDQEYKEYSVISVIILNILCGIMNATTKLKFTKAK